jgi:nitrite reductase/ring-hydroxylating ferredoxin subunit
MFIVKISTVGAGNCAQVAGMPYVYADAGSGSFVLPASCPHRGGPLHLAQVEPGRSRLICPWHARATSVTKFVKAGLPAVRRGDQVTIVFPHQTETEVVIGHRPMSAALAVGLDVPVDHSAPAGLSSHPQKGRAS